MFHEKHSIKYYMEEKYYEEIIKLAKKAYKKREVPVGAIVVKDGKILSKAYNKVEKDRDATMHAEILAIKKASKKIKNWRLNNCEMYVTLEPCMMCTAAIELSRIKKVHYLLKRDKEIMVLRYGLNNSEEYTQKEVADLLGISQSYISRIEKKVIKKLQTDLKV